MLGFHVKMIVLWSVYNGDNVVNNHRKDVWEEEVRLRATMGCTSGSSPQMRKDPTCWCRSLQLMEETQSAVWCQESMQIRTNQWAHFGFFFFTVLEGDRILSMVLQTLDILLYWAKSPNIIFIMNVAGFFFPCFLKSVAQHRSWAQCQNWLRKAFVGELKRKWFGQVAVFYLGTRIDISHCVWNNGLTVFQDIAYSYFHAKEYFW